jgi:Flp pilus assembly protein TadG
MRSSRTGGQALVEFAFALPVFAILVFATIQLGLLFVAYYSETRMARESARWLAINSSSTDLQVAQHVPSPGTVTVANKDTVNSTATDTIYVLGNMSVQFTTCGAASAPCTAANRAAGNTLYLQVSYNVSNILFLPTTFRFGSLVTKVPTQLPAYRVSVMVE